MRDLSIKLIEFTRMIPWQNFHGTEPREATFLASRVGDDAPVVRLIRVQGDDVIFSRRDLVFFQQPVDAWEAEALAAFEAEAEPCKA